MTATIAPKTFVWDNDYKNHEQVRPYFKDYLKVRTEIEDNGQYTYNDLFKGRIPGLAESDNEDTGIYLLQTLHALDQESAREAEFLASGARWVEEFDWSTEPALNKGLRGTLVMRGRFMGGTGYEVFEDARVTVRTTGAKVVHRETGETVEEFAVLIKKPRQREWRRIGCVQHARFLFKEN